MTDDQRWPCCSTRSNKDGLADGAGSAAAQPADESSQRDRSRSVPAHSSLPSSPAIGCRCTSGCGRRSTGGPGMPPAAGQVFASALRAVPRRRRSRRAGGTGSERHPQPASRCHPAARARRPTTRSARAIRPTSIETRERQTLVGRLESEAPNSLTLRDGASQQHVILRSEVDLGVGLDTLADATRAGARDVGAGHGRPDRLSQGRSAAALTGPYRTAASFNSWIAASASRSPPPGAIREFTVS